MSTKKTRKYTDEDVEKAVHSVREEGISLRSASETFKIPKSTLSDIIHGRVPQNNRRKGPEPFLSSEGEENLVEWISKLASCGFPVKRYFLQNTVEKIVKNGALDTPFSSGRPGKTWLKLFLQRHPELSQREAESISKGRAIVTEQVIRKWFTDLKVFLTENNALDILEDPSRIFNGDETGLSLCPRTGKVIGPKNYKNIYEVSVGNEKETITVLLFFSAQGDIVTPLIVYPYTRIPPEVVKSVPENWAIGRSESGWMKSNIFYEYMANEFDKWLTDNNIKRPILSLVDGHKSHMTFQLSEFCNKNQILLYALPPNCTHILQPADVSVFRPLKSNWKKTLLEWQCKPENVNCSLTKLTFAPLLKQTLDNLSLVTAIQNGFRACGLYPFDENAIDYTKCVQNVREHLILSSSQSNLKMIESAIQNIAPQLLSRGIDASIIIEELRKAQSPQGNRLDNSTSDINVNDETIADTCSENATENLTVTHQKNNNISSSYDNMEADFPNVALENGIDENPSEFTDNMETDLPIDALENSIETGASKFILLNDECNQMEYLIDEELLQNDFLVASPNGDTEVIPVIDLSTCSENNNKFMLNISMCSGKNTATDNNNSQRHLNEDPNQISLVEGYECFDENPSCSNTSDTSEPPLMPPATSALPAISTTTSTTSRCRSPSSSVSSPTIIKPKPKTLSTEVFKEHLFYPSPVQSNNRRPQKEKQPSAISSQAWRDFYAKKEAEKESLAKEKEKRKEEQIRKKEEQALKKQEEQAKKKEEQVKKKEEQAKRKEEQAKRKEEQAKRKEEKAALDKEKQENKKMNKRPRIISVETLDTIVKIKEEKSEEIESTVLRRPQRRATATALKDNNFVYYSN